MTKVVMRLHGAYLLLMDSGDDIGELVVVCEKMKFVEFVSNPRLLKAPSPISKHLHSIVSEKDNTAEEEKNRSPRMGAIFIF